MGTRSEQVQAYRFVTRRIVSALLSGEPETTERPMRRFGMAIFGSVMVATLIFAGAGVYGFLNPTARSLPDKSIVIERETGARYVFFNGALHPVLNYASARLVLGTADAPVQTVSEKSLRGRPRGRPVGIANAPDPLPTRAALTGAPWSVCSSPRQAGAPDLATQLGVADVPTGGEPLGDSALLLTRSAGGSSHHLVVGGRRLAVDSASLSAIGLAAARPVPVTEALLNSIPPGPALAAPPVPGEGDNGPPVGGRAGRVGQLYLAAGQHYVLLTSGLATVGRLMKDLLLADGGTVLEIAPNAAAAARSTQTPDFDPPGFPGALPTVVFGDRQPAMVCTVHRPGATADAQASVQTYLRRAEPGVTDVAATPRVGPDGVRLADRVVVPGGRAVLGRLQSAPGDTTVNTTTYLITDRGLKYAMPRENTAEVLSWLGYEGVAPSPVPNYLLALLPSGPTLDPRVAREFVSDGTAPTGRPSPSRSS